MKTKLGIFLKIVVLKLALKLSISPSVSRKLIANFLEVEVVLQENQTRRQTIHFTSLQAADRVAAAFCFRYRCTVSQSIQIENLVKRIQNPDRSKSVWLMNRTNSVLPVFFHHTEGLTELQLLKWTESAESDEERFSASLRKQIHRFCADYNCSKTAGHKTPCESPQFQMHQIYHDYVK